LAEKGVPPLVASSNLRRFMCPPIDLDDQSRLATIEVDDIKADRMLPAKFEAAGALAEMAPE
jgi:hypothetical protein